MKNGSKLLTAVWAMVVLAAAAQIGFGDSLTETNNSTNIDGVIKPGEYSYTKRAGDMTLYANWSSGALYFGLEAETEGWVSVGFGSRRMDGAHIIIGFSDGNRGVLKEQTGMGHKHPDTDARYVQDYDVVEEAGVTTMEFVVDAAEVLGSIDNLPVIMAFGSTDALSMYHGGDREGFSIQVSK
jgi:hypothetical protein